MTQVVDQPPPVPNSRTAIQDLVIADIEERKQVGVQRYGTTLQAFNGREALVDAYQEAMDLTQYLRQEIEERALIDDVVVAAKAIHARDNGFLAANGTPEGKALVAAVDALLTAEAGR